MTSVNNSVISSYLSKSKLTQYLQTPCVCLKSLKLRRLFSDLHQAYSPLKAFQVNNNALQSRISSIKAKHLETPSAENLLPFIRIQLSFLSLIKGNRSQYTSNIRRILAESRSFASSSFQLFITPIYVHIRRHMRWIQVRLRWLVTYFI